MVKKKVAVIGTAGIPAGYGGFETLAEHLTRLLGEKFDFTVYCSKRNLKGTAQTELLTHNHARLVYLPWGANGKQSIVYDFASMLHALRYADVMLTLGVSGGLFLPIIRCLFRGKIIVNIDGLEWKRDKWLWYAKWFLRLSEASAVLFSDVVIADHPIIQEYVKKTYGKDAIYIAYGADHVVKRPLSDELIQKYPFLKEPYALSVCHIEPENNVHMILDAMTRPKMMDFVIIGNWDGNQYAHNLKAQCLRYGNVHMLDPIYDQTVLDQFRSNCAVYIHGHSAGGTNPSLIEELSLKRRVFAYSVAYNRITAEQLADFFASANELYKTMTSLGVDDAEEDGLEMSYVNRKYLWRDVVCGYEQLFCQD